MERFKINRNGPKMDYYDVISLTDDFRTIEQVDETHIRIYNDQKRHHLALGQTIYFRKRSGTPSQLYKDWGTYAMSPVTVTEIESEFSVITTIPNQDKIYHIIDINAESNAITLDDSACYLPEDFEERYGADTPVGVVANLNRGIIEVSTDEGTTMVNDIVKIGDFFPVYRHNPEYRQGEYVFDKYYDRDFINPYSYGLSAFTSGVLSDVKGELFENAIISRYTYNMVEEHICLPSDPREAFKKHHSGLFGGAEHGVEFSAATKVREKQDDPYWLVSTEDPNVVGYEKIEKPEWLISLDACDDYYVFQDTIDRLGGTQVDVVPEDPDITDDDPDLIYTAVIKEECYFGEKYVTTAYTYYQKAEQYVYDFDIIGLMALSFDLDNNPYFYNVTEEYQVDDDDEMMPVYRMYNSVDIVRSMMYYEIPANLPVNEEYNLLQQNTIEDLFSSEVKSKIIPDFIDMEKFMFEPALDGSGDIMANELVFNLHFRFRNIYYTKVDNPTPLVFNTAEEVNFDPVGDYSQGFTEFAYAMKQGGTPIPKYAMYNHEYYELHYDKSWSTNDNVGWNNLSVTGSSDVLGVLNFNDDDVNYQKMKLKKSFIRLSFYDTNNPLTQRLLYYSTIFLDSGEYFGKFVRNRATNKYFGVFTDDVDEEKRLGTRVTVKDKYNSEKSSEGFYLYLFGNEFDKSGEAKDVYMKVEFNHAGYGRTLPMTKPYGNGSRVDSSGIPLSGYFSSLFIKLRAKYKPYGDCNYIYFVDEPNENAIIIDTATRTITFNLFEVKIR